MSTGLDASLFVTTYEMPQQLALVCAGLERQTARNFEIFFCDDGSGDETKALITALSERIRRAAGISVHHLWQENKGFRKCRILNEALRQAMGRVCVFLDGDCIPHPKYVADHLREQEEGRFLAGRRVELGPKISSWLTPDLIREGFLDLPGPRILWSAQTGDLEFLNRFLRIPSNRLRALVKMDRIADLKGCNYSVSRKDLLAINGFDEEYEGYGREDTDVELRLNNLGLKIKSLKGLALEYHVWHPRREFTPVNDDRLEQLKTSGRIRCEKGVNLP